MSKAAIIGTVVPGVLGVLALAATVPLDQAKSNLATYSGSLFLLGIILLIVAVAFAVWGLVVKWRKPKHETAPPESHNKPVDHWAERQRLEISVLANKPYWIEVLHRWQMVQTPPGNRLAQALHAKRIPLLTFLDLVPEKGWRVLDPPGYGGFDLIHGLSESAGLGDVLILGKPVDRQTSSFTKSPRLQRIPIQEWSNIEIDPMSCFNFRHPGVVTGLKKNNAETMTKCDVGNALAVPGYADLHIATDRLLDWLENYADSYRGYHARTYSD